MLRVPPSDAGVVEDAAAVPDATVVLDASSDAALDSAVSKDANVADGDGALRVDAGELDGGRFGFDASRAADGSATATHLEGTCAVISSTSPGSFYGFLMALALCCLRGHRVRSAKR